MTSFRIRENDLMWQEVEGELIVLDADSSMYLRVAGAGLSLWPLLTAGADRATLVQHLVTSFGIDAARAGADVDEFLQGLRDRHLLVADA